MAIRPWFASSSPLPALLFSHGGHNSQLMSEWPTAGRNARQACMLVRQRATIALHCTGVGLVLLLLTSDNCTFEYHHLKYVVLLISTYKFKVISAVTTQCQDTTAFPSQKQIKKTCYYIYHKSSTANAQQKQGTPTRAHGHTSVYYPHSRS